MVLGQFTVLGTRFSVNSRLSARDSRLILGYRFRYSTSPFNSQFSVNSRFSVKFLEFASKTENREPKTSRLILFMFRLLARDITGISRIYPASLGNRCTLVITAALRHTKRCFVNHAKAVQRCLFISGKPDVHELHAHLPSKRLCSY